MFRIVWDIVLRHCLGMFGRIIGNYLGLFGAFL